jgi:hypothetical protein
MESRPGDVTHSVLSESDSRDDAGVEFIELAHNHDPIYDTITAEYFAYCLWFDRDPATSFRHVPLPFSQPPGGRQVGWADIHVL